MHRYTKINLLILGFEMDHGAEISNKGSSRKVLISSEDMDLNQHNTNKIYHYSHCIIHQRIFIKVAFSTSPGF